MEWGQAICFRSKLTRVDLIGRFLKSCFGVSSVGTHILLQLCFCSFSIDTKAQIFYTTSHTMGLYPMSCPAVTLHPFAPAPAPLSDLRTRCGPPTKKVCAPLGHSAESLSCCSCRCGTELDRCIRALFAALRICHCFAKNAALGERVAFSFGNACVRLVHACDWSCPGRPTQQQASAYAGGAV